MNLKEEIEEKMKKCDLVLVCPNKAVERLAIFLTKLVFPPVEYSPLSPIFGYKGKIYGISEDRNLARILIRREYESACVLHRKIEYRKNRLSDVWYAVKKSESGKIFVKYAIVSVSGILFNMLFFSIFYGFLKIWDILSLSLAIELSIILTFLLNNYWTFSRRKFKKSLVRRMLSYHVVLLVGTLINILVYYLLSFTSLNYLLSDFVGIVIASIWNLYMVDVHVFFAYKPKDNP